MEAELVDNGVQVALIQFRAARRCPLVTFAGCAEDRLGGSVQSFFGVVPIENLSGLGKQFLSRVPDPGRAIAQHHATGGLGETSPRGFAQNTLGEVGTVGAGVGSRGAFNGGRIGDGSGISHRLALLIARFRGPYGDEFGLASFGGAIGLLAGTTRYLGLAHRHSGTVQPEIDGRSDGAYPPDAIAFIGGDLGTERLRGSFHLTDADFYPSQFVK